MHMLSSIPVARTVAWYVRVFAIATVMTALVYLITPHFFDIGDTPQYVQVVLGQPAMAPFAYRVFVPALVSVLPWGIENNFLLITIVSTIITLVLSYALFYELTRHVAASLFTMVLLSLSYTTAFYLVEYGRIDPFANTLFVLVLLLIQRRVFILASIVLTFGVFTKESMLILLPVLIAARMHARPPLVQWRTLLFAAPPLIVFALLRAFITPAEGIFTVESWADLNNLWALIWQLNIEEQGWGLRIVREILRSYGFYWVLAACGCTLLTPKMRWLCLYLLLVGIGLCATATDWSRMVGTIFPAIFLPVAVLMKRLWSTGRILYIWPPLFILAILQLHFALVKYTDLPHFGQIWMFATTIAVCGVGSLVALWSYWQLRRAITPVKRYTPVELAFQGFVE